MLINKIFWFKFKFLPGGELAKRPVMYIDGDETFTKTGVEATIGAEIYLKREKNDEYNSNLLLYKTLKGDF